MKRLFALLLGVICTLLTSCSDGNLQAGHGPASATILLNTGDVPNDQIITFELFLTSVTLTNATGTTTANLLPNAIPVEFIHNAAHFEALSLTNVPTGTYTGITLGFSNATVVILDPASQAVTPLGTVLATATATVTFNPALVVSGPPLAVDLDLDLANSVVVSGSTATITPQFTVGNAAIGAASTQDDDSGEVDNIYGRVSAVSASSFTILAPNTAQSLTFTVNSGTQFKGGLAGLSQIVAGEIVSVDGVTQSDGSLLALSVEAETDTTTGEVVQGTITAVTGAPATSITVTTQTASATTAANAPLTGNSVIVPLATALFSVQSNNISGPLPAFDATTLSPAQAVRIAAQNEPTTPSTTLPGDKIKLQEQALSGTVSALGTTNFVLTVDSTSAFQSLTSVSTVTVNTSTSTQLKTGTIANGDVVRVRGLLFFDGTRYTLVASRITAP
jgi:hypothetical protein